MVCCTCKIDQDISNFTRSSSRKSGYYPRCKSCCKEYYNKNKLRILENKTTYWFQNKPKLQMRNKLYYEKNQEKMRASLRRRLMENRESALLYKVKERAGLENMEFDLTREDIIIPEFCPYLGIKLTNLLGYGQLETNSSIDRIDSSRGYTKDNIQVISRKANTMKNNATKEELIIFAQNILKMHGETN